MTSRALFIRSSVLKCLSGGGKSTKLITERNLRQPVTEIILHDVFGSILRF